MSNKKNIDRLFQEKFKDFEAKPDPKNWQQIQSKLKEKDNDRTVLILPIWLKVAGVAASFVLLLFLGQTIFNTKDQLNTPNVVNTNGDNPTKNNLTPQSPNSETKDKSVLIPSSKPVVTTPKTSQTSTVSNTFKNKTNTNIVSNKTTYEAKSTNNSNLVNKNNSKKTIASIKNKATSYTKNKVSNSIASTKNKKNSFNTNRSISSKDKRNTVAENNIKKQSNTVNTFFVNKTENKNKPNNTVLLAENKTAEEKSINDKENIEDAIAKNEESEEDIKDTTENSKKWKVNANVAPVYYNTFGEGSHIAEEFNTNNKSGEINTSYGVKVGYALNDKLTLRSGVNRLDLSYDTDNVIVYENVSTIPNPKEMRNVNFNAINNHTMNIISSSNLVLETTNIGLLKNVALSQRISYFEIPVEVEYAVINKKFNLNIIGGFSSFVLDDNALVSEYDGFKTEIGQANNINDLSFSANFGLGLNYNFSKSVILNIEPTFKYQLNAFSDTSGNFNPYIIGVYTGLNYKF